MSNQLLPCPFCGHDEPTHDEGDQSAWVQCTNFECGMCGPIASGPSLAATAWNRRATQPAAGDPVASSDELAAFEKWRHTQADSLRRCGYPDAAEKFIQLGSVHWAGWQARAGLAAPPAAAHGDEAVRGDATEEVMQRACAELPEDWYIEIHLENGSGYATLFNDGIVVDFGQDFESMGAQVEAAIDAAMRDQGDGG